MNAGRGPLLAGKALQQEISMSKMKLLPLIILAAAAPSFAAGCLSGAAVGGVGGHVAGHHAVAGAVVGCAVGHHMKVKQERKERAAAAQQRAAASSPR
jgi:membrane associated rhomboid family serine protease